MDKKIFEILVSRENLKWPWIFEHILIILHNVFDDFKGDINQNNFSFEITKVAWRIRFFIVSPSKYSSFLKNQIYAHFSDVEIIDVQDYLEKIPDDKIIVWELVTSKSFLYPIKNFTDIQEEWSKDMVDPFSSITSALDKSWKYSLNTFQVNFSPITNKKWKKNIEKKAKILESKYPQFIKKIFLDDDLIPYRILVMVLFIYPVKFILYIFSLIIPKSSDEVVNNIWDNEEEIKEERQILEESGVKNWFKISKNFLEKIRKLGFQTSMNIISASEDTMSSKWIIKEISSTLWIFSWPGQNSFVLKNISNDKISIINAKNRNIWKNKFILNTSEISGLVHLPTSYVRTPWINWVSSRNFEPPSNLPIIDPDLTDNITPETDLTPIWKTNFRWTNMSFGIWPNDRRRHMYIIWKTWMGKSVLLENMIIDDIKSGRWVAVIDPHGDLAEAVIWHIPKSRTNSTIIFDPSDTNWPIAFNMLDWVKAEHRPLVASGLVGIFKKIFGESWGPRLEHILRNTILALIEYPNTTLISIPLMLTSDVFRNKVVNKISDPIVKKFWTHEFAKMAPNQKVEASGPILNKVWQFLSSTILRNVLGQSKNTFNVRWAMDNNKIVIVNLSKWKIGEDASALLWAMMITKFQMDAMARADIPESERKDFYLYVDEFQNFATDSFATILSEARKYKLNLVMANQYIDQMQESVRWAVFGNVWSIISFQVGYHDAAILKEVLWAEISEDDLTNLAKYNIYLKQLIDWMPSPVFSSLTFPPHIKNPENFKARYSKILNVSREKYSKPIKTVVDRINKTMEEVDKAELAWDKKKAEFEEKKKEDKQKKHAEMIEKRENEKKK
jgi:hypothetical protein